MDITCAQPQPVSRREALSLQDLAADSVLRDWLAVHIEPDESASVSYGDRQQATVPVNDLVRIQYHLPDGRRVRIDPMSPCKPGAPSHLLVAVEAPAALPGSGPAAVG
jgi:hypothetical protein